MLEADFRKSALVKDLESLSLNDHDSEGTCDNIHASNSLTATIHNQIFLLQIPVVQN